MQQLLGTAHVELQHYSSQQNRVPPAGNQKVSVPLLVVASAMAMEVTAASLASLEEIVLI